VTVAVLALRGIAAVAVLTMLAGGIPRLVQAILALAFGLWSALLVAPARATFVSVAFAARELAIGAAIGIVGAVPLIAAAAAGRLVDVAGGRARGPYGALFGLLAAAVFVGLDGHVVVARALVESHRTIVALGDVEPSVMRALGAIVPVAIRLAVPWLVTAAIVEIAIGAGVRVASRAGHHAPVAAAVPAALVMLTASLVATLAIAVAALVRG
jgi:hypothetical protein